MAGLNLSSPAGRHAVRLAVALAGAVAISHTFRVGHWYWLPLTVVLVLRSDFITTFTRGIARSVGTLAGAGLVTLLLAETRPSHAVLVVLTLAFYWAAVTILFANYTAFSVFIASLVVTLLAFTGAPAPELAGERSLYTLLGAALALVVYALWPTWERSVVADRLAALVEAEGRYGRAVLGALADPDSSSSDPITLHRARAAARLARSNAEASVDRWLSEPYRREPLTADTATGILAAVRRYVRATLALHATLSSQRDPQPGLARLAEQVEGTLLAVADALRQGEEQDKGHDELHHQPHQPAAVLPPLRDSQLDLARSQAPPVLVSETDVIVDAVNSLCRLVGLG